MNMVFKLIKFKVHEKMEGTIMVACIIITAIIHDQL